MKFVLTVPYGGAVGGIQAVQTSAGSPYQVLLRSAGASGPRGTTVTASPVCSHSPAKKTPTSMTAGRDIGKEGEQGRQDAVLLGLK